MRYLLDTHVLLRWMAGEELRAGAVDRIADPESQVFVSAASIWEISIKEAIGKLTVDGDLEAAVGDDFDPLPINLVHARHAGGLPPHHRDPFDRMLVAQTEIEHLTLVSRDRRLEAYGVPMLWA